MINHIKLHDVATFTELVNFSLKDINFIYGGNGTGKTTISQLIAGNIDNDKCSVNGLDMNNETVLVYNKHFVDKTFRGVGEIAGIFTLGEDTKDALGFIEEKEKELQDFRDQIAKKRNTLNIFDKEIKELEIEFQEKCWKSQTKYGSVFPRAMIGSRGSKVAFSKRCLEVYNEMGKRKVSGASIEIKSEEELNALYHAAYSKEATRYQKFPLIDTNRAPRKESKILLSKRITGKLDSDIGRFIEYLGASDWVKTGTTLAKKADGKCPYCARVLPENLEAEIEGFFDVTYKNECEAVKRFVKEYCDFSAYVIDQIEFILSNQYPIGTYEELKQLLEVYVAKEKVNKVRLEEKIEYPSKIIELEPCEDIIIDVNRIITVLNHKIENNNNLVEHQEETQNTCSQEVWRYISNSLALQIKDFLKLSNGKGLARSSVYNQLKELQNSVTEIEQLVMEKRASISSVEYTVQAINKILGGYGFMGFELAENKSVRGTYRIIRADGSDAKTSLSEGEYNFITFLYFYHMVFGSRDREEIDRNKIIVIDDPISSLDSNVLFIVSSLVKNILDFCRSNQHSVRQVIVSTHNIYFHKEITFIGNRNKWPESRTAFFILRKKNNVSSVTEYPTNPIQSSYEVLWDDIRTPSHGTAKSIFNTMRRILENYFKIIGGIDYEKCVHQFNGEDKLICRSLISCINEQSHTISDDYYMSIQDSELEHYIQIFREIFQKMNHISHYNMMMRIASSKENERILAS